MIVVYSRGRVVDSTRPPSAVAGNPEAHKGVDLGEDGAGRSYDLVLSALRDRKGRHAGRLMVLRDITERKRAEARIELGAERRP